MKKVLQIRGHHGRPQQIAPREPVLDIDNNVLYFGTDCGSPVVVSNNVNIEYRLAQIENASVSASDVSEEAEPGKIVRRTSVGKINGDITGASAFANALSSLRRIRLTGGATGQVMFNGTSDVDIVVTLRDELGNPLGNMNTTIYDTDGDGIVDRAKVADNVSWAGITDLPTDGFISAADKEKLNGIEAGAQVNVQPDWEAVSGAAQILNKPTEFPPESHIHNWDDIGEKPLTFPPSSHGFHVPANGTTNDKKVLTASAVDGTFTWEVAAPTGENTDGGGPSSIYLETQSIDGGMP